jgi:hypothetical protein
MENYLLTNLHVPGDNIRLLTNHDATRSNILKAISEHLTINPKVEWDDNIIIYFAGHGSSYHAREQWANGVGSIEALCPVNRGIELDGHIVPDISDREVFFMLNDLRKEKGNRVTIILDCCHSSGISRGHGIKISGAKIRGAPPLLRGVGSATALPVPVEHLLRTATNNPHRLSDYSSALDVNWKADLSNLAMLVACRDLESAWEVSEEGLSYGAFTNALVKAFKAHPLQQKTYLDLIELIGHLPSAEIPRQHPTAFGDRINNPVFT